MSPSSADPSRADWRAILVVVAAGMAAALQIGKVPAAIPVLQAEFGFDLGLAALLISLLTLTSALVGMAVGLVADRFGRKRLMLIGLGLNVLSGVLAVAGDGLLALFAGRLLESVGFICIVVGGPSLILGLARGAAQRQAIALWSCYMPAGAAIMMLLALPTLDRVGWRGFWLLGVALNLVVALALWRALSHHRDQPGGRLSPSRMLAAMRLTVTSAGPVLLAAIFGAYAAAYIVVLGLLPAWLTEAFGLAPGRAAALTGIAVGANIAGNLATGWLLNRGVARAALCTGTALLVTGLILAVYLLPMGLGPRYGLVLAFSAACGIIPSACFSGVGVHAPRPDLIAATNGLIMQGSQFGQLVVPPVAGKLVEVTGSWPALLVVVAPLLLAVAVMGLALGRLERQSLSTGTPHLGRGENDRDDI